MITLKSNDNTILLVFKTYFYKINEIEITTLENNAYIKTRRG